MVARGGEGRRGGPLYRPSKAVERCGGRWPASELRGRPLMALGRSRVSRSGASGEAAAQGELLCAGVAWRAWQRARALA